MDSNNAVTIARLNPTPGCQGTRRHVLGLLCGEALLAQRPLLANPRLHRRQEMNLLAPKQTLTCSVRLSSDHHRSEQSFDPLTLSYIYVTQALTMRRDYDTDDFVELFCSLSASTKSINC